MLLKKLCVNYHILKDDENYRYCNKEIYSLIYTYNIVFLAAKRLCVYIYTYALLL